MGSRTDHLCLYCGTAFIAGAGGGFFFDLLHWDRCGRARSVRHEELGDIHLAFVKGLPGPYAIARRRIDDEIKATYEGPALSREEYHAAVEETFEPCECGGRFAYAAVPRCPSCRSLPDRWVVDPNAPHTFVDC
jgi:hypothetical protein